MMTLNDLDRAEAVLAEQHEDWLRRYDEARQIINLARITVRHSMGDRPSYPAADAACGASTDSSWSKQRAMQKDCAKPAGVYDSYR